MYFLGRSGQVDKQTLQEACHEANGQKQGEINILDSEISPRTPLTVKASVFGVSFSEP